jgi:hypothetical protein
MCASKNVHSVSAHYIGHAHVHAMQLGLMGKGEVLQKGYNELWKFIHFRFKFKYYIGKQSEIHWNC